MSQPVVVSVTVPDLPVVTDVSVLGIQGSPGISVGPTPPADEDILWADTSELGDAVVPQGGTAGQALVKVSGDDYDTDWETLTAADVGALADSTPVVTSDDVSEIVVLTQAAYDLLTPDAATLYIIVG